MHPKVLTGCERRYKPVYRLGGVPQQPNASELEHESMTVPDNGNLHRRTALKGLGAVALGTVASIPARSMPSRNTGSTSASDPVVPSGDRLTNDPPPEHENVAWARVYGSAQRDRATGVVRAHDDGYVVTGEQNRSLWIAQVDATGRKVWG